MCIVLTQWPRVPGLPSKGSLCYSIPFGYKKSELSSRQGEEASTPLDLQRFPQSSAETIFMEDLLIC